MSINHYKARIPEDDVIDMYDRLNDITWFVSEFYTKGADLGLANDTAAGWIVTTQKERAEALERINPSIIAGGSVVACETNPLITVSPSNFDCDDVGAPQTVTLIIQNANGDTDQENNTITVLKDPSASDPCTCLDIVEINNMPILFRV